MKNSFIKYYCVDCGKEIQGYGIRCSSCCLKGNKNGHFIDGRKTAKHYCIEPGCNNEICYCNWLHGNRRCGSCARKGKRSHRFGKKQKPIRRQKYKEILMRSSYEVAYAKKLDKLGIKWRYEPKVFNLGKLDYTPDFYLPDQDLYIEIKGFWRDDAKKKFDLFKKLYPDIRINVFMKKELKEIGVL